MTDYVKQGKRNRLKGAEFERKVRKLLESNLWIVDKWGNNVDLEKKELCKAKMTFNPYNRAYAIGTGFPDFICLKKVNEGYMVFGVECKSNGVMRKEEKEKAKWLIENEIFNKFLVASNGEDGDVKFKEIGE